MFGREFAVLSICVFFFRPNVLADKPDCVRNDNGRNISSVAQGKQFILQFGTCKIEAQIFIGRNQAGFIVLVDKSGQGPYYYLPIEGKMEKTKITFRGAYFGNTKTIFCEPFTKDKRENLVPVVYVAEKTIYNMYVFFDKAEYYELTGWEFTGWKTITVGVTT
ncbi:hypothetical protein M3Y96_01190400 [Aphelenchoides besseyi]|nr:hypothetical protein M3Y96_01190400 [Aphelenchoides besseyi]